MTTQAQVRANKQNALRSTGPKSKNGKRASRSNAMVHGLRTLAPILPGECPQPWMSFLKSINSNLLPVGTLEEALTARIALALWRLNRVTNYESAAAAAKLRVLQHQPDAEITERNKLEDELKEVEQSHRIWEQERQLLRLLEEADKDQRISDVDAARTFEITASRLDQIGFDPFDPEFLAIFGQDGVMIDDGPDPYDVIPWQVSHLIQGVDYLAKVAGYSLDQALETLHTEICKGYEESLDSIEKLRQALNHFNLKHEEKLSHLNALHGMLSTDEVDKVCKYEGHLNRVLFSTLERLQLLQSLRRQEPASLPTVAVGITLASSTQSKHPGFMLDDARLDSVGLREVKHVHAIQQPIGC